ncbi:MAG TPA: hypothetical protein VFE05_17720 [Longimicrobiaceae bacterium]|nr:hypothetical protein [Longimicrobiaceae bacterium]
MGLFRRGSKEEELRVEVGPDAFVFHARGTQLRLVAEVGTPPNAIPLFPMDVTGGVSPSRYQYLQAFLHGGFLAAANRKKLKKKPRVILFGASSLDAVLHGYQYELLRRAAMDAGASSVRFADANALALPAGYL